MEVPDLSQFIVPLSNLPTMPSITATQNQQKVQPAGQGGSLPFASLLEDAVKNLAESGEASSAGMYNLALGQTDDLHTGAIQAVKTSTAVSYTAGLTSAAIRAYNELIRMQI